MTFPGTPIMKVMTVSLPCRAHSGWHAGIVRWAQSRLCEFPSHPPPSHDGPRCIAGRLRRRGAVLRETPPAFHGPRCIAGRLRRRGAVLRETPPAFHGPRCIAGRLRRRGAVLRETPPAFHGPRCIAGRLRRRGAVLRETPPAPPQGGGVIRESLTPLSH
jgi:hypothetical protein